jgi:nucleotide-binding universal stress UspA family protein
MSAEQAGDRIVVGVDGSEPAKAALVWAARQARTTGSPLVAVAAWEWPTSYGWSPPWPAEYDPSGDALKMLEETVRDVLGDAPDVPVTIEVLEGHPSPALVELSKRASLLVVGSRGHGEFAGMLIGSVSEFLVAHAHCPVVVVRH